jgi:hypothetical protein
MRKWNWDDYTNDDIKDEITLIRKGLDSVIANESLTERQKQRLFDEYLDKLNSLYDEQRKRGTFKGNTGTT